MVSGRADIQLTAVVPDAALTGYGHPKDRARALEAGFDFHVVMPVPSERLQPLLANAPLRRRRRATPA